MITRYDQVLIDGRHWENRAEEVTRGSMELQFAMGNRFWDSFDGSCFNYFDPQARRPRGIY